MWCKISGRTVSVIKCSSVTASSVIFHSVCVSLIVYSIGFFSLLFLLEIGGVDHRVCVEVFYVQAAGAKVM